MGDPFDPPPPLDVRGLKGGFSLKNNLSQTKALFQLQHVISEDKSDGINSTSTDTTIKEIDNLVKTFSLRDTLPVAIRSRLFE